MPSPGTPFGAALYRFVAMLIVLVAAVAIVRFSDDATMRVAGIGLAAAVILALEEFLKSGPGPT